MYLPETKRVKQLFSVWVSFHSSDSTPPSLVIPNFYVEFVTFREDRLRLYNGEQIFFPPSVLSTRGEAPRVLVFGTDENPWWAGTPAVHLVRGKEKG